MSKSIESQEERNSLNDSEKLKEKLAVSNHVTDSNNNYGKISNLQVIPQIKPLCVLENYPTDRPNQNVIYSLSEIRGNNTKYDIRMDEPPFTHSITGFYNNKIEPSMLEDALEIREFDDLFYAGDDQPILIEDTENNEKNGRYIVCKVSYQLIADFESESNMYNKKDLVLNEFQSVEELKNTKYQDFKNVEYKIDNNLSIRKVDKDHIEKNNYKIETFLLFGFILSGLTSYITYFIGITSVYLISLSLCFTLLFSLLSRFNRTRSKYKFQKIHSKNSNSFKSISLEDVVEKHNKFEKKNKIKSSIRKKLNQMPKKVNVRVESDIGDIVCENRDISWDLNKKSSDIYKEEVVEFFTELGFEDPPTEFETHIIPVDSGINTRKKTLKSRCGEWLLVSDYVNYNNMITKDNINSIID